MRTQQRGNELRFTIDSPDTPAKANPGIARHLARAHRIARRVLEEGASIDHMVREEGLNPSYVTRMIRLTFLAPDILARLLAGEHRPDLSARQLMADTRIPLAWAEQRTALDFG